MYTHSGFTQLSMLFCNDIQLLCTIPNLIQVMINPNLVLTQPGKDIFPQPGLTFSSSEDQQDNRGVIRLTGCTVGLQSSL